MYSFPLFNAVTFYALLFFLSLGSTYANDSSIALVRDRYGGSLQYDTRFDRPNVQRPYYNEPRGDTEGIRPYYSGNPYDRSGRPIPQYNVTPPPYGGYGSGYGGGYYPPNADIDPDETMFRQLYHRNQETLGQ